jgi:DNA invertase Pin-like site-specific DNA recombinase
MKIGYARVSTDAQETHLQLDALTRATCSRIYQEKASGATADRPELLRLLDNARQGDVVIVWKLDRLARSLRQLIDTMALFHERGVALQSLTENINTTTPSGKLTFHLFGHWFRLMSDPHERCCWTTRLGRVLLLRGTSLS